MVNNGAVAGVVTGHQVHGTATGEAAAVAHMVPHTSTFTKDTALPVDMAALAITVTMGKFISSTATVASACHTTSLGSF